MRGGSLTRNLYLASTVLGESIYSIIHRYCTELYGAKDADLITRNWILTLGSDFELPESFLNACYEAVAEFYNTQAQPQNIRISSTDRAAA